MKKIIIVFVLMFFFSVNIVYAHNFNKDTDKLIVSGETIGIDMDLGIVVQGTYGVKENNKVKTPWKNVLKEKDKIIAFNGKKIKTIKDLQDELKITKNKEVEITILRDNNVINNTITPALKNDNTYSLGIIIKDRVIGIGTLTYVVPEANLYGALGHSINAEGFEEGTISKADVTGIKKGSVDNVGEKNALISRNKLGSIIKNEETGIYGSVDNYKKDTMFKIGLQDEVKTGKAYILTCVEDDKIEKFEIEIVKKYKQNKKDIKSMKVKVTDPKLIEKTGGIIQGMSGSPIIQNGKLIGALTHVLVSNPKEGYGIYIQWMLEDNGVTIK